jgi:HEPN domain-containing protein
MRYSDSIVSKRPSKLLKALLSAAGGAFPKTRDLPMLLGSLSETGVHIPPEFDAIDALTPFGSVYRYEDLDPVTGFDKRATRNLLRSLRTWCEQRLESLRTDCVS